MHMKIIFSAAVMIFINNCAAQEMVSFNPEYVSKVLAKYDGNTLTPANITQVHLHEGVDYSYKMIDLEENQIYSYNYTGMRNDMFHFEIVTTPSLLRETISLDKHARFMKSNLFFYNNSCSFVLGLCERIRQTIKGTQHKEKVETSFKDGIWIIEVYREINNEYVPHSLTHSVYDKQGLPIYNKVFLKEYKILSEFARVL